MQSAYFLTLSFFFTFNCRATGSNNRKSTQRDVRLNGGKKHEQIESLKTDLIANFYKSAKVKEKHVL